MWIIIACDVVIFILGILIGRLFFSKASDAQKDLEITKIELGDLRNKMKHHLSETAFLFQQFDDQYQKLLQHFGDMSKDISSSLSKEHQNDPKIISSVESLNDLKKVKLNQELSKPSVQPKDYED
ncbi:MAG: DUF1043 family protein [Succinivibrionaceae bacterium]|nr:DUF1043 family protein [Succinivibrionaceae bacterium]